ncbi:MAG: hypothetical protein ACRD6N_14055 [Pyrinomonadaceae bacterium]
MRHRFLHFLSVGIRGLISAVVKSPITAVVFTTSLMITLLYMGVPVPSPHELIDKFEVWPAWPKFYPE